jgi:hypothetical protein
MRQGAFVLGCIATLLPGVYAHGSDSSSWVGVWQSELDRQPGVTLTLAQDTGDMGGTVVLNVVSRESGTPPVIMSEPHVLMHPHVDGNTLSFQVKRVGDAKELQIEVKFLDSGKAQMRCLNCGPASPTAELVRNQP